MQGEAFILKSCTYLSQRRPSLSQPLGTQNQTRFCPTLSSAIPFLPGKSGEGRPVASILNS